MVTILPANAGDTGSIPGPGRFHMLQDNQARKPQLTEALAPRSTKEATAMRSPCTTIEKSPNLSLLEKSPQAAMKIQYSQK